MKAEFEGNEMELRLWEYIDGFVTGQEKTELAKLIETNIEWRNKYRELLEAHHLMQSAELEHPSLRFTKNVMEEIAKYHIAPAAKTYINKRVIWGIAAFFFLMILGLLVYGFGQIEWTTPGNSKYSIDLSSVDYGKFFNNTYTNVFMMINVVLGLVLLDRYLTNKKKKIKEA
jgi:hypothetical protein